MSTCWFIGIVPNEWDADCDETSALHADGLVMCFFFNPSELQQAWERDGLLTSTHGFFNWNSQPFFFRLLDSFHIFQDFASFPSVFAGHQSYVMSLSGASVGRWCCRWWQPSNASSCWSLETMAPGMETRQCGDGAHGGQGSKHWNLVLDTYNINIT